MAPSRKKGGGKAVAAASARRQWKVGDLVLAKVKGFPAWPAAVSEPEKWGYAADWKKVLVHFFGTQQIAFCNPADVESFTEEKKQSLLTKRHAKGSDFVRAVKEITESYEKLKQQGQANDPKSAEELTVGSSGNTVEMPQAFENQNCTRFDTRDDSSLLSEDASAAEQMLALRHNGLGRNGACDSAIAKDLCEIDTYSSRRRNERGRSQKCGPQKIIPVERSKLSSRLELDRFQSSMLQCSDGGHSVDGMHDGAIRKRKRIRRSDHAGSDVVVSSAPYLHGSDEENASEIATVESEYNSRNEGNGEDSGSRVEHSDSVSEGCEGGHEINKGLDFQISTMVKRKKRKPTRKRETSDLIDPPAKVEAEEGLGAKECDSFQRSQQSHERLNERSCEGNGDEHLPLVKRARVRMSRAFYAEEKVNASSPIEERSSKDTLISAAEQTSPSVNHENDIVSGHDTSAAEEFNSFQLSAKLPDDMDEVVPSHIEKPSDRMSPSRACVQTVSEKKAAIELHENECSMTPDDKVTRAQSNQLSSSPEGEACVPEAVQGYSEESQTRNCLNSESNPIDMQYLRQSAKNETPSNPETVDSSADKAMGLCLSLDMTASWVPAQSPLQPESQDNDSCDHSLVLVGDSLNGKCEKIDCHMTEVVQPQAVERSPLFCSVVNNQEAANMQETGNTLLKEKQGRLGNELDLDKQAQVIQNPVLVVTESDLIVEEAVPQCETMHSHCEDVVKNREQEKRSMQRTCILSFRQTSIRLSCEADEQKKQIQATNSVPVSDNLSREKMSLSPARGTPRRNPVCHISTAESANVMQNTSKCTTDVQFSEEKLRSDDTVKEEMEVETCGVTQVKKVVSSDVQFTIESFETALGSLVRTKETIGRATRLALDLVKFGASAKVMEILAHTLESESNLQRRVDLFFLVDSIAQCSKGLNGSSGGVYLSSIQVMLPRLLAAAVPAGATTQENRRQCLKVLRLWLERRILPESIIRHHIRELDEQSNVPACLYSRRSARTERALDDPVRDMEGMLVDEYGSNSTLHLPGFCIPTMVKDEEGDSRNDSDGGGGFESVTPEHESRKIQQPSVTERHTRILEDVDGELEMEDVAPPWEGGSIAITGQATECSISGSYDRGDGFLPNTHGDDDHHQQRMMNPPPMRYRSPPESSSYRSLSKSMPRGESRPYPPPPTSSYYNHIKSSSRREGPSSSSSYSHRSSSSSSSHYTSEFDERDYYHHHERMRPEPFENRDNWRYHHHPPSSSHGTRYHDRHKGPYNGHHHHHHNHHNRDSRRYQNQRWSHSPRGYNNNNRHSSFHYYKQHSESGPVSVGMRDPSSWHHQR